ncbi:MAG: helix-turn-helix transcriptional regulator [Clostridia bacterium]|nr:helix-turn-helix transcriptional regulator [Clostridia bacterium]
MDNFTINSPENTKKYDCIVDYRNNKSLAENGISFHWWGTENTSLHCHNFYELFIVTDGKALHELNGKVNEVNKGALFLLCPEDCHRFKMIDGCSCSHMNFCVTTEYFNKICDSLKIDVAELENNPKHSLSLTNEEMNYFTARAQLLGLISKDSGNSRYTLMCEIVSHAVVALSLSGELAKLNYPEWFAKLLEKLHSPEMMCCSAADVYKTAGFSPPVTVEYFKRYTGKTVAAYLRDLKCAYACDLLDGTKLSTLEISARLGYYSLSHFNRIFKEYSGTSPAAYRRRAKM